MSDAESTHVTPDAAGHGHDLDHGGEHATAEPLGPVDVATWGYALAGSLLGLLTVLALFVARGA